MNKQRNGSAKIWNKEAIFGKLSYEIGNVLDSFEHGACFSFTAMAKQKHLSYKYIETVLDPVPTPNKSLCAFWVSYK